MRQIKIPAAFIRGGTSNAIVFKAADLPSKEHWDAIFLGAMGSPDPYGRQLNGMGGGISSLSKVCVVGPSTHPDADIDYTFAQVAIDTATVDYGGNCGNMSSAMGPFAVDEGMVRVSGDSATVRIHNTNTAKVIEARFALDEGLAAVDGDVEIPGVASTGAAVDLDYLEPGGAGTGQLLPTGNVVDTIAIEGLGEVKVSLVDAANPFVFVEAKALGLIGNELPTDIEALPATMAHLESIRAAAGVLMGYGETAEAVTQNVKSVPKIGIVSPPRDAPILTGETVAESAADLTGRMVSMGTIHRALPLTGVLGLAVAARIEGTVVHASTNHVSPDAMIRIVHPSGVVEAASSVEHTAGGWYASLASVRRTQRRLFDGFVYVPASRIDASALIAPTADAAD